MSHSQGRRVFVTGGDRTLNFSGCAYYLMKSLAEELPEFRVEAVPIHSYRTLYGATAKWGLRMLTDPRPHFFMTRQFQNANWRASQLEGDADDVLISLPQIAISPDVQRFSRIYLYVDMTHRQYLSYGQFNTMPSRVRRGIIAQERASYVLADRIFACTLQVKMQLTEDYAVPPDKIEIVGRGVNMPDVRSGSRGEVRSDGKLRVCFMGLDFERKGLRDLIEAIDADTMLQQRVALDVIGPEQTSLPRRDYMEAHGYIDKDRDLGGLISILDRCDVGYLFSRSEGIPGSVLDFLSRGRPCLISDIPQMGDLTRMPGVVSLPLARGAAVVGDTLRELVTSPERLRSLKENAGASVIAGWKHQAQCIGRWCSS